MPVEKYPSAEPVRGYRLIEPLGSGGFGEVWKCEAPGGIHKAIKFVYGNLNGLSTVSKRAESELRSVQHIKSIRHPFLLAIDRVESVAGELIIITELADRNLFQLWETYRNQGLKGIPRLELLGYLREAAEVLDLLNLQANLQHLDIKPTNLFLVSNHVKVADFGLVQSMSLGQPAIQMNAITPLYAAPEIFLGQLSRHCDLYSLAIVFQELLSGTLPFDGKNARQLLIQHTQEEPNLSALPEGDRELVARALHKNPDRRFSSCMEFVRLLEEVGRPSTPPLTKSDASMEITLTPMQPADVGNVTSESQAEARAESTGNATGKMPSERRSSISARRVPPNIPADFLTDYSYMDCQNSGPLGETWRIQSPDGRQELLQLLYGCDINDAKKLREISNRLTALQHPGLLPLDQVRAQPGRILLVSPLIKETVRERFQECRGRKLPGIPRGEMIDYVRAAAEVLDYLFQQHSLHHLSLCPRSLVLDRGWLQMAEFGLAQIVWLSSGQDISQRNARYAAPELFRGEFNRFSDQYSLALIYAEMVTGEHPFQGQNPRRRGEPNLAKLSPTDRDIIGRALSNDPAQRWPSTSELAMALEGCLSDPSLASREDHFAERVKSQGFVPFPIASEKLPGDIESKVHDLVASLGGVVHLPQEKPILNDDSMQSRFAAGLPIGAALLQLEPLVGKLGARMVRQHDQGCTLLADMPGTFWQRMRGKQPALEIRIGLKRVQPLTPTPIEISVHIEVLHCPDPVPVLDGIGRAMLERIRQHFMINAEKRAEERFLWPNAVHVLPLYSGGAQEDPIECRGKEISASGMGLFLPHEIDTTTVMIQIPNDIHPPCISVPATLVRAHRCADGWYDVGTLFYFPAIRKSLANIELAESSG